MSKFVFDFGRFGAPFWLLLGRLLGAKLAPKSDQNSTKNRPAPPDGPKIAQDRPRAPQEAPRRHPEGTQKAPKSGQEPQKGSQQTPLGRLWLNVIAVFGHGLALSNSFAALGHGLALSNSFGAFRFQLLRFRAPPRHQKSQKSIIFALKNYKKST